VFVFLQGSLEGKPKNTPDRIYSIYVGSLEKFHNETVDDEV